MFRVLLFLALLASYPLAVQADELKGPISAEVLRIVDGDTVHVRAMIWVNQSVEVSVRLRGADAPELFKPKCPSEKELAYQAKAAVAATIPVGTTIALTDIGQDKYGGRVVANIETELGETLSAHLIAKGQAIAYGTKKPWCGV